MQRDHNVLATAGVQNCALGTHREAPTASIHRHGDASVFGPNDADSRGHACPMVWDTGFYERTNASLKEQPLHGHTTPGSCTTIRSRGLPTSFRDLETDRRAHDDRVRGDPVVHGREPVPAQWGRPPLQAPSSWHGLPPTASPSCTPAPWHKGSSTTPSPRSFCAAGEYQTGAFVGRYGQGAV